MNALLIEEKFGEKINSKHNLALLSSEDAILLLEESKAIGLKLLGVEAFKIHSDGHIQPSMEFSNISFGKVENSHKGFVVTELKRKWRELRSDDGCPFVKSKDLILRGAANGFTWFEVSLEDPITRHILFFRD